MMRPIRLIGLLLLWLLPLELSAQITIGGNVYGGGNEGEVKGNTTVVVKAGNIGARGTTSTTPLTDPKGKVFGGARMANVGGNTFVHIDGKNATGHMVINYVYGGNDIAGIVGSNDDPKIKRTVPEDLTQAARDGIDDTWNTMVRISSKNDNETTFAYTKEQIDAATESDPAYGKSVDQVTTHATASTEDVKKIYIGQLFAGGNGDYSYDSTVVAENTIYTVYNEKNAIVAQKTVPTAQKEQLGLRKPVLARTYLDVHGGSIVYAYGGGNNATVTDKAVIRVENPSAVTNDIMGYDAVGDPATPVELLTTTRFKEMGINTGFSHPSSDEYQVGCFFGGNNKTDMAIRPTWHLIDGKIRSLYSGGNRGRMIYQNGLFLEVPETSRLEVGDLFGGCRMADVRPMVWDPDLEIEGQAEPGGYKDVTEVPNDIIGYTIPRNLAARVVISGGKVHNVYGGNDVTGRVYFGNAIGIRSSISGNVYGGGNGNYPYTDNIALANHDMYSDLYYEHPTTGAHASVTALNAFRPNAEQVSIHIRGKDAEHPTIIGGSVFVGGNCATLMTDENHKNLTNYPLTELKIGSWSIIDNVYLGNNGEGMVGTNKVEKDANDEIVKMEGVLRTYRNTDIDPERGAFNSMDLTDPDEMAIYMQGVSMNQVPRLTVDQAGVDREVYEPYTSFIGSIFFGGNRGSMAYSNAINITPTAPVYIYSKLVAGCNNANIPKSDLNARFEGGILGSTDEQLNAEGVSRYIDGSTGKYKDRIVMNLSKIKLLPMRLNTINWEGTADWSTLGYANVLEWNTFNLDDDGNMVEEDLTPGTPLSASTLPTVVLETGSTSSRPNDKTRRLVGGNIFGGCHLSGHVNGNVVISLKGNLHDRKNIFDAFEGEEGDDNILYDFDDYNITARHSGVILNEQGMDVLGEALTVYGGGKGKETEIWGSTSVNIERGYNFQVFGGADEGAIGKGTWNDGDPVVENEINIYKNGYYTYPEAVDTKYNTTVTLNCGIEGVPRSENTTEAMADVEFIYGGGFSGPILGNTRVNLNNGRLFNSFAGSCNADINGHTETYVGLNGFPYLRDHIYGGNDLGGKIKGAADFDSRVNEAVKDMVHSTDLYRSANNDDHADGIPDVLQASAYIEYRKGYMRNIFGGCFGDYDYQTEYTTAKGFSQPEMNNAFVNFRPDDNSRNHADKVFGAGQGSTGNRLGDKVQNRSYVLVDIANDKTTFSNTEVFGGGDNNGLGVYYTPEMITEAIAQNGSFNYDKASAIIDLMRGQIRAAYGGSYNEGITGRTVVNVPSVTKNNVTMSSTIKIENIFGGAYGTNALPPCDVYESNVNFSSGDATVTGAIYGGNNNVRRTIYSKVNINAPVWKDRSQDYYGVVYGAGYGPYTWSEYTQVNLNAGAKVYQVFGGGQLGQVLNAESVQKYMQAYQSPASEDNLPDHIHDAHTAAEVTEIYNNWNSLWKDAWTLAGYYEPNGDFSNYNANTRTNLANALTVRTAEIDERDYTGLTTEEKAKKQYRYNTNVIINKDATVTGYAYGGGLGASGVESAGAVTGSTYIAVLGGTVDRDVYGAGRIGPVYNAYGADFKASTTAYVEGGTARNVYGGGYEGHVGKHTGGINTSTEGDVLAETHVVIGKLGASGYDSGEPAITRNVYGAGEGGSVYGTTNVTINNGYIGYRYKNTAAEGQTAKYEYAPELDDNGSSIEPAGNVFGGGYVVNSYADETNLKMYGGTVRSSLYGGGEIGPVGRGTVRYKDTYATGIVNNNARIFKAGKTKVTLYDGWVKKNVFGGGRGYDNWGGDGTLYLRKNMTPEAFAALDLKCKGFVFGQTEVNIHGGEIGTEEEMQDKTIELANKNGNVFGGGDVGFVYSAYQNEDGNLCMGKQSGTRYDDHEDGYYYEYENNAFRTVGEKKEKVLTKDCMVLVEPWLKPVEDIELSNGTTTKTFKPDDYIPTAYLNSLGNKNDSRWNTVSKKDVNKTGIIIHNAVFAGGNTSSGSTEVYANTTTVYGNATASVNDVYHRDLITVGTGHTGGLYGEGNLTLVDGYRELNITNYGTDYYSISPEITYAQYQELPVRESAYYEIRYKCAIPCTDKKGKNYGKGSTISADELATVFEGVKVDKYDVEYEADGKTVKLDAEGYPVSKKAEPTEKVDMLLGDGTTPQPAYWVQNGVCSRYAGRIMNTIQRADFCGVFGSRMVMQGAQDRVPETVDYTNYTINRVREVSLNKKESIITADAGDANKKQHGNYFGIYNIVNYLGALTSDVDFGDEDANTIDATTGELKYAVRTTDNSDHTTYQADIKIGDNTYEYGNKDYTYYNWKKAFHNERKRNNGKSHNKLALASGVYLELTTEKGEGKGDGLYDKDWGYITGVVELDLINVQTGMGGGFVYAKNIHGVRSATGLKQVTLADQNDDAVSRKHFSYTDPVESEGTQQEWQTSGNFVHSTQTIIDDCYNIGDRYKGEVKTDGTGAMPAHYWYIKGSVYVYDQYISAYTGSPNAYSEVVNIPLTITSASHGKLTLLEVQPNHFAYYSGTNKKKLEPDGELVIRDVTYRLNDPINYWEWFKLSEDERALFVPETYVTTDSCKIGDKFYPKGYVMLYDECNSLFLNNTTNISYEEGAAAVPSVQLATIDADGNPVVEKDYNDQPVYKPFNDVFHESNNMSHDTGYILTYNVNNPKLWGAWYTPKNNSDGDTGAAKVVEETYRNYTPEKEEKYEKGPTYTPTTSGIYGQQEYKVGNLIAEEIYNTYEALTDAQKSGLTDQASFERAYIVTADILEATNKNGTSQRFYKDAALPKSDYVIDADESRWDAIKDHVSAAYVVTSTIQLNKTDYIYRDTYMTEAEKTRLYNAYKDGTAAQKQIAADIEKFIVPAYYCTSAGKYGGDYYEAGKNYRAAAAFSGMSESDRSNFTFNYDALDLLIDPTYDRAEGVKYQYDVAPTTDKNNDGKVNVLDLEESDVTNPAHYSLPTSIDYTATYRGATTLTYTADDGTSTDTDTRKVLTNTEYENLLNERYHYAPVKVTKVGDNHPYYVVNKTLILGDTPYAAGQVIDQNTYDGLNTTERSSITTLTFETEHENQTFYFCREPYKIAAEGDGGKPVTDIFSGTTTTSPTTYNSGDVVPDGAVISETDFKTLTNKQQGFVIHGMAPTETSTLYVVRNSDINDLTSEKIITVIYQYDYVESDVNGLSITPVSERHVLNIHINFRSGVPTVEDIQTPDIVLPGTTVAIKEPFVSPGAYEVTGGGWELFDDPNDAESHMNGIPYTANTDPLYLYQNNYLVAYYAQTYLGKTYSNAVPVSVANYHDLKKVMGDEKHHYYIDHKDVIDKDIDPKIYINDYTETGQNGLDLFKDLYNLSLLTTDDVNTDAKTGLITTVKDGSADSPFKGHALLDKTRVGSGNNLEFFLRTDIDHSSSAWTSIGGSDCFAGTLHGDGHHLSGLSSSLFDHLCGDVYNLGVSGKFTGAGIAEAGSGYMENCWISTSSTEAKTGSGKPVFGTPSRTSEERTAKGPIQMVNCYYDEEADATNPYTNHSGDYGIPTRKPHQAFFNGEVAYNLNGFYLYKRYRDNASALSGSTSYKYWQPGNATAQTGYYGTDDAQYCSSGSNGDLKYVEDRFRNGDFVYAAGTIPDTDDERLYTYVDTDGKLIREWYPIWPDDYLFFGQSLNYNHVEGHTHQDKPSAINRSDDSHVLTTINGNRVYRAPAYYRRNVMETAYFNPYAVFAQTKKDDASVIAYKNMTAIDFTDAKYGSYKTYKTYDKGLVNGSSDGLPNMFYPPLLDDDGLSGFRNVDLTRNLLAYTFAEPESGEATTAGQKTAVAVSDFLWEPDYTESDEGYRRVATQTAIGVFGHWVKKTDEGYLSPRDHFLVDKQDFNAPISYQFNDGQRMWYQRYPDALEFVDRTKGWQTISLPFTAELVTTHQKGEITHFYGGSTKGHEYWLRQLSGTNMTLKSGETDILEANMSYPAAGSTNKRVTNTFLWDYYYHGLIHNQKDRNSDVYNWTYYKSERTHAGYSPLTNGTPYILGLPGVTYYEFDLSGQFNAETTAEDNPEVLEKQYITFASATGATIGISDDEIREKSASATYNSTTTYTFTPSYMNTGLKAGTNSYTLKSDGSQFDKVPATGDDTPVEAFRPYFTAVPVSGSRQMMAEQIVFNSVNDEFGEDYKEDSGDGALIIKSRPRHIIVKSTLKVPKEVTIHNAAGICITTFIIHPGQTVETLINMPGFYIVNKTKLAVR